MGNRLSELQLHLLAAPSRLAGLDGQQRQLALSQLTPQEMSQQLMQVTFEAVAEQLQQLERLFFEMDGSFVWTGEAQTQANAPAVRWQLDGMLYDVGGRVQRVELKGCCPQASWRQLLGTLAWPEQSLVAYNFTQSCFVDIESVE